MLDYGSEICADITNGARREWLVTNGLGGYAMGTIAGLLSRSYHGLLIAATAPPGAAGQPPAARTLLLAKLDETVTYDGETVPLFSDERADEPQAMAPWITPKGFRRLERFHLEGTIPVWTFALADARLEKRVWMQQGANTTYVRYTLTRANRPLKLRFAALATCRDHHGNVAHDRPIALRVHPAPLGLRVTALDEMPPFFLFSDRAQVKLQAAPTWLTGYHLAVEHARGQLDLECYAHVADFEVTLRAGEGVAVVASTDPAPNLDAAAACAERSAYEQSLVDRARSTLSLDRPVDADPPWAAAALRHLVLAADQFIVRRDVTRTDGKPAGGEGKSVIAGYPWFGDWGRDTMISLPGLTLVTGRPEVARQILTTFARFVDRGMLPNRFPDAGELPEYNTVDATLWYFEAIRAYHAATDDVRLVQELYPVLQEIVAWHQRGTRYNIHVDPADGLLYAGEAQVQLTWMDAKVDDWVVTPRIGKPVEINALWYNALRTMAGFARLLGRPADAETYEAQAGRVQASFARFWNNRLGYCYDVLDGPSGHDASLRPNQLFAVSLPASPLEASQARSVVDACARHLVTPHGLRSLAAGDPSYIGRYGGNRRTRDAAYHQGTVWGWLIGPFVSAHLRVYRDPGLARTFLYPLLHHLNSHGVGSLSEIFDGDPPHTPRGCVAQAWTVAEVLRAWQQLEKAQRREWEEDKGKEGKKGTGEAG